MTFKDVQEYFDGCLNTSDLRDWLKYEQSVRGYEESFDGSLTVVFLPGFAVLITSSYIQELREVQS